MKAFRFKDVNDFLNESQELRHAEIIRTNLISSIANSVSSGARVYEDYFWWVVKEHERVVGLAIRTVPFGYVFSPMPKDAVETLLKCILQEDPKAVGFSGPKVVIDEVEKLFVGKIKVDEGELIYSLENLIEPEVKGSVRVAQESDFDLIHSWMLEFAEETKILLFNLESVIKRNIEKNLMYLLEVNGEVVSFGGFHTPIEILGKKIGRVGPIYTPKTFRKNGYASQLTAYLSKLILNQGAISTLYTQAHNLTSNKIYQEIGYQLVDENRKIEYLSAG